MKWYLKCIFNNYATFRGRARRKEFWMFTVVNFLINVLIILLTILFLKNGDPNGTNEKIAMIGLSFLGIYNLIVLIPHLAVIIRRLHDINQSGWMILLLFIPVIGYSIILVLLLLDSSPGHNRFGSNPKAGFLR